jgi:hypothetical protein
MKNFIPGVMILVCLASGVAFAQSDDAVNKILNEMQAEKDGIIESEMKFTGNEKTAFSPLYREYQEALRKVQMRGFQLISRFAREREADTLANDTAERILKEYFDIEREKLELKKSYIKKFGKILPYKKVLLFFQVENKMDVKLSYLFTQMVPLAK